MKKFVCILLCAFVIGSVRVSAYAEGPKVETTLDIGKLNGHTTYQIGGAVDTPSDSWVQRFPTSELEFPLDVCMISVGGSVELLEKWKLGLGVKKNITDDAGKMEDSDWGINYYEISWWTDPDSLDIYSESDAELDALIMDINLRYKFYEKSSYSFIAGLGYIRQNFDYEISNLDQWYPSCNEYYGYDIEHLRVSGRVLTYEVTYSIPYMEIGIRETEDKLSVEASIGYSPFVNVKDEDHHLLRSMVSYGDCDGDAVLFSLEVRYDFPKNWFLTLGLDYMKIETDGKSKTYVKGAYDYTIDQRIESEQTFIAFAVGYAF